MRRTGELATALLRVIGRGFMRSAMTYGALVNPRLLLQPTPLDRTVTRRGEPR